MKLTGNLITAHKRSLGQGNVLTCLSVILFTGGGGYDITSCYGYHHPPGQHPAPRTAPPPTQHLCPVQQPPCTGPWTAPPLLDSTPLVNKQAVRILLECFLVNLFGHKHPPTPKRNEGQQILHNNNPEIYGFFQFYF